MLPVSPGKAEMLPDERRREGRSRPSSRMHGSGRDVEHHERRGRRSAPSSAGWCGGGEPRTGVRPTASGRSPSRRARSRAMPSPSRSMPPLGEVLGRRDRPGGCTTPRSWVTLVELDAHLRDARARRRSRRSMVGSAYCQRNSGRSGSVTSMAKNTEPPWREGRRRAPCGRRRPLGVLADQPRVEDVAHDGRRVGHGPRRDLRVVEELP